MTKNIRDAIRMILAAVMIAALPCQIIADDDFGRGNIPDGHYLSWGSKSVMIYGQSGANGGANYFRVQANGGDMVQVNGTGLSVGTNNSVNKLDVSGNAAIGTYGGVNVAPSNGVIISGVVAIGTATAPSSAQLTVFNSVLTSTGLVVQSSGTADIADFQVGTSSSASARILANGAFLPRLLTLQQVNNTIPIAVGEIIAVSNYNLQYLSGAVATTQVVVPCIATGTLVSQYMVLNSSTQTGGYNNGCGSGK